MGARLIAALLLLVAVGCQKQPPAYESRYTPPPPPAPVLSIAVVGDSYTAGTEMGGVGNAGWPALVETQLRLQGVDSRLQVGAVRGAGYVEPGAKDVVFSDQLPRVAGVNSRLVVLFGSLNDASIPADQLGPVVAETLTQAKEAAPDASLVVLGPPWPEPTPPERVLRTRDVVREQAQAAGVVFVDTLPWFADRPDLIGSDGIHPTDAGHVLMAEKITPLIAQQLQQP